MRLRVRGGSERAFADEADAEGEPTPGADVEAELRMLEEEEQMLINEIDELREAIGRNRNRQKEVNK